MNGHLEVETQNPQEIKNFALRSLEEYRTELEEEQQHEETQRKERRAKGKGKKVTSTQLLMRGHREFTVFFF